MLLKNTFELFDRDGGGEIETQEVLFTMRISERRMSCAPTFASSVDLLMSIFCLHVPSASPHVRSVFERAAISLSHLRHLCVFDLLPYVVGIPFAASFAAGRRCLPAASMQHY